MGFVGYAPCPGRSGGCVVVVQDPTGGSEGGAADHILPGGVARREVEAQEGEFAGQVGIDIGQLGHTGGGLGLFPDLVDGLLHPLDEVARAARIVEDKDRRALHGVADHRHFHTARQVENLHAAVVGGDQGAFGCGHRNDEFALRVFAPDGQRAGKAQRHLGDAGEVLDVAAGDVRIKGVLRDVLQLLAGELLDEFLAFFDDLVRVVVGAAARDLDRPLDFRTDGAIHLQGQVAEILGREFDLQLMNTIRKRLDAADNIHDLAQREIDRLLGQIVGIEHLAGVKQDGDIFARHGLAVELDALKRRDLGIAEAVFQREADAVGGVPQAVERVELFEHHAGNWQRHGRTSICGFLGYAPCRPGIGGYYSTSCL